MVDNVWERLITGWLLVDYTWLSNASSQANQKVNICITVDHHLAIDKDWSLVDMECFSMAKSDV